MGYGRVNQDAVQSDLNRLTGEGRFFKIPKDGVNVFFCPPWNEQQTKPYQEVYIHYNFGDGGIFACLKQFNQPCPACAANQELRNYKGNKVAEELSKDIYAKIRYIYNIIPFIGYKDVPVPTGKAGCLYYTNPMKDSQVIEPKVWPFEAGIKLHKLITSFFAFNGDIYDPTAGNMICLSKMSEAGKDPKFASTWANPHPMKARLEDRLMVLMNNLPDLSKIYTPEPLEKVKNLVDLKMANFRALMNPVTTVTVPSNAPQMNYQQVPQSSVPVQQNFERPPVSNYVIGGPPTQGAQVAASNPNAFPPSQGQVFNAAPTQVNPAAPWPPQQPQAQTPPAYIPPPSGGTNKDLDIFEQQIKAQQGIR